MTEWSLMQIKHTQHLYVYCIKYIGKDTCFVPGQKLEPSTIYGSMRSLRLIPTIESGVTSELSQCDSKIMR